MRPVGSLSTRRRALSDASVVFADVFPSRISDITFLLEISRNTEGFGISSLQLEAMAKTGEVGLDCSIMRNGGAVEEH